MQSHKQMKVISKYFVNPVINVIISQYNTLTQYLKLQPSKMTMKLNQHRSKTFATNGEHFNLHDRVYCGAVVLDRMF